MKWKKRLKKKQTGWIQDKSKDELLDICKKYKVQIPEKANIDSIRKTLREFIKDIKTSESDTSSIEEEEEEMARAIGKLLEFAPEIQAWEDYIEQFEFYLDANNITDSNKKRSTLLTAVGVKLL